MSYLDYPRIHFSGQFQADPSTINNTPNNYNPEVYPAPNDLEDVELYWAPLGTGTFKFQDCVVSKIEYSPTKSTTSAADDPIIGQPIISVNNGGGSMLSGGVIVDLDPAQQNVSEVWGMEVQIGSGDTMVHGQFTAISFNAIWQQGQGPTTPRSSASGSAIYQSQLTNLSSEGSSESEFIKAIEGKSALSINMVVNAHNNAPDTYDFSKGKIAILKERGVSDSILSKIAPLSKMYMNRDQYNFPTKVGLIPTRKFVEFMMKKFITPEEYNSCYETVFDVVTYPYQGSTNCPFLFGRVSGSVGLAEENAPSYFVPSRMMNPTAGSSCYFTAFKTYNDGKSVVLNLGNSLATNTPDIGFYESVLGKLYLVSFPDGDITLGKQKILTEINYMDANLMSVNAGFVTYDGDEDLSTTPLGILSVVENVTDVSSSNKNEIILAENKDGLYLRADQFVYRMNPGFDLEELGKQAKVSIHALKFGEPFPGAKISMTKKTPEAALKYTLGTLGESGTHGVYNVSTPLEACVIAESQVTTDDLGVATFTLNASDPGNPRIYVNGQVYFIDYDFVDFDLTKDVNDIISVQVYGQVPTEEAVPTLQKFGRIYKVMDFLTEQQNIDSNNYRNKISTYLNSPISAITHMPVTRDLSLAELAEITNYIDKLNTPPPRK